MRDRIIRVTGLILALTGLVLLLVGAHEGRGEPMLGGMYCFTVGVLLPSTHTRKIQTKKTRKNRRETDLAKDPSISIIRGRLAADPEYRTTGNGIPVVNLRILSSGWEKDTAGNPVDVTPTSWQCEAWRELAEHIVASLGKGDQIMATVRPQTSKYEKRDGGTGWSTRWVIEDIGPSLQRATTAITRIQRGQHATPQPPQSGEYGEYTAPANDPWTN